MTIVSKQIVCIFLIIAAVLIGEGCVFFPIPEGKDVGADAAIWSTDGGPEACIPNPNPSAMKNTGSVQVTVTDYYSNEPLAHAKVVMMPGDNNGVTGLDGTVTFTGIMSYRNYILRVSHDRYSKEDSYGLGRTGFIRVQTGQITSITIPLKKSASIHGTVTSSGAPVSGAFVVLARMQPVVGSDPEMKQIALLLTNKNGNYQFSRLPEGVYTMRTLADSHNAVTDENLTLNADAALEQNIALIAGDTSLSFTVGTTDRYYGTERFININLSNVTSDTTPKYEDPLYFAIVNTPAGGEATLRARGFSYQYSGFSGTVPGDYTAVGMLVDGNGICKSSKKTIITLENHPTESLPAIIPGPSELPLLDSGTVFATTAGTNTVVPGVQVYLRGWGRDYNLGSPEMFNADAPMFDIYGNKNGDWHQSEFSFAWSLRGNDCVKCTGLLSSTTSQNVHFKVPDNATVGDTFTATLRVTGDLGLAGPSAEVSIVVADTVGNEHCISCHGDENATYSQTTHAKSSVDCESCHGPGSLHGKDASRISKTHWPGNCGQCHKQFAQWQHSRHSDPLAFGHAEISKVLTRSCYKCHYTDGFIGSVESTGSKVAKEAPADTPNVSCDVCHDPHVQSDSNPFGIRTGSGENLCNTCHEKKWQNATYTGGGDKIGNAVHFADYSAYQGDGNPHAMPKGCVFCHMAREIGQIDDHGVAKLGSHTLRMREAGADGILETADDILNIGVCQGCHAGLKTFDRNGVMTRIKKKLGTLESLLKTSNHGYLPPFQPGKCSTCHKGGTLPFIEETKKETLNKAYINYKLVLHDRSFGIHNPGYIERLLDDSILQVQAVLD